MENRNVLSSVGIPLLIILIGSSMRLIPHIPNVTPVSAIALFSAVYMPKKYAVVLPLSIMLVSDLFIGFHQSMPYVYASFLITCLIGFYCKKHPSFKRVVTSSLLSSLLFFLITNFGFWLTYSLYPKTMSGQIEAYIMALPFFRNTLFGDLAYTGLFFGSFTVLQIGLSFWKKQGVVTQ